MTHLTRRTVSGRPDTSGSGSSGRLGAPPAGWERYERLEFVGRGGMGSVYSAWDPRLRRAVALKFLHISDTEGEPHFLQEARAQARVSHPNVCEVFEVGEVDGRPYVAMQLIRGRPLSELLSVLARADLIAIVRDVARAAHAAHVQGLIHRDIKPSNIMVVTDQDGHRHARVVDFGLSRPFLEPSEEPTVRCDRDAAEALELTLRGQLAGTPAYMSPEQALGVSSRLDARSDVYSIGCTLYECLLGRPPHAADSRMELLLKVTSEEPRPPRGFDRSIPADLESVVMRCLRKDPAERYPSAAELADDLEAVLEHRRVRAHRGGVTYLLHTLLRRSPTLSTVAALLLSATMVATGMWGRSEWRSARQAAAAQSFGAQVARLESLLWKERSLPVHDIGPAVAAVRARMEAIEAEIERRGEVAGAPGHLALGNAHLALGELDAAVEHLEIAWAEGHAPRETAWALGSALGAIYQRGLSSLETITDPDLRATEHRRLDRQYGDRARDLLRRARGCTSASPLFVDSVLALAEGRTEDGLRLAGASFAESPWQYEAKLLEGDLLVARARDVGDGVEAARLCAEAEMSYRAAAAIAPSDPSCYARLAGAVLQRLRALHPEPMDQEQWERAVEAADTAATIDSSFVAGRLAKARLHLLQADQHIVRSLGDPAPWHEVAKETARAALAVAPGQPEVLTLMGEVHVAAAKSAIAAGRDPSAELDVGIDALSRAAEVAPSYTVLNNLGIALRRAAAWNLGRGREARPLLERAAGSFARATRLDEGRHHAWSNLGWVRLNQAQAATRQGVDPVPLLRDSVATFRRACAAAPERTDPHNTLGLARTELAKARARQHRDSAPVLDEAVASFERALRLYPDYTYAHNNLGNVLIMRAGLELDRGRDPSALLDRAEWELLAATERAGYATAWFNLGVLEGVRGRLAVALDHDPVPILERARTHFERGLEMRPGVAAALAEAARIELQLARAHVVAAREPTACLERCRGLVREALEVDDQVATAWALRARAALLEAGWGGHDRGRLGEAVEAAERARGLDPDDRETLRTVLLVARESRLSETAESLVDVAPEVLRSRPRDSELRLLAALVEAEEGPERSGEVIRQALASNPYLGRWYGPELARSSSR